MAGVVRLVQRLERPNVRNLACDTMKMPRDAPDMRDIEFLAVLLDSQFRVPFTQFRLGLDPILGLIPGVGDAALALPAFYILYRAHRLGVRRRVLARMGWNIAVDLAVGAIPLLGDFFDAAFRANLRNLALLRQELAARPKRGRAPKVTGHHDPGCCPVPKEAGILCCRRICTTLTGAPARHHTIPLMVERQSMTIRAGT